MKGGGRILILVAVILIVIWVAGEVLFFTGDAPRWRASLAISGLALVIVLITAGGLLLRYRSLPQAQEKRGLESEQSQVQRELETVRVELEAVEATRWSIEHQERADLDQRRAVYEEQAAQFAWRRHMIGVEEKDEVKSQLWRLQAEHITRGLAANGIVDAAIPGVGPALKAELAAEGIRTAADVAYGRVAAVRGFGRAKANSVVTWRASLEWELDASKPERLPPELAEKVENRYDALRAELSAEERAAQADLEDDLQAIERRASAYYVKNESREDQASERLAMLQRKNAGVASALRSYANVHPAGYLNALLLPDTGHPRFYHRLLMIIVPLVFVASLFCQGATALRALVTMALDGQPLLAPVPAETNVLPETSPGQTRSPAPGTPTPQLTASPESRSSRPIGTGQASEGSPTPTDPASSEGEPTPLASSGPAANMEVTATPALATDAAPTAGSPGADMVLAFSPGPGAQARYLDAEALLGAADADGQCCQGMIQLGRSGSVLLAFVDNTIVDGPGADFRVRGESARDDFLLVEVSDGGAEWFGYPEAAENTGGLDLAEVGLAAARLVRLTDLQPSTPTGAEVDAVVAMNNGPPPDGELPPMPNAVARRQTSLRDGPSASAAELSTVNQGAALAVLGHDDQRRWVQVRTEAGEDGWCLTADLGLNVSLQDYP